MLVSSPHDEKKGGGARLTANRAVLVVAWCGFLRSFRSRLGFRFDFQKPFRIGGFSASTHHLLNLGTAACYSLVMSFRRDDDFARSVEGFFGEYVSTFTSTNNQIRADLFKDGTALVAHVSYSDGVNSSTATDAYLSELKRYAHELGFDSRFRLVFSG